MLFSQVANMAGEKEIKKHADWPPFKYITTNLKWVFLTSWQSYRISQGNSPSFLRDDYFTPTLHSILSLLASKFFEKCKWSENNLYHPTFFYIHMFSLWSYVMNELTLPELVAYCMWARNKLVIP